MGLCLISAEGKAYLFQIKSNEPVRDDVANTF